MSAPETEVHIRDRHWHFLGASQSHCVPCRSVTIAVHVARAKFLSEPVRTHRRSPVSHEIRTSSVVCSLISAIMQTQHHCQCRTTWLALWLHIVPLVPLQLPVLPSVHTSLQHVLERGEVLIQEQMMRSQLELSVYSFAISCHVFFHTCAVALWAVTMLSSFGFVIVDSLLAVPCTVSFVLAVRLVVGCVLFSFFGPFSLFLSCLSFALGHCVNVHGVSDCRHVPASVRPHE